MWTSVFNKSQIHIVDGDLLITNPLAELTKIEKFLGLPHYISEDHIYFNETKRFFCIRSTGCLSKGKGRPHPTIDQGVIDKLQRFYAPHNEQFFSLTGRTFNWHYK